MTNHTNQWSHQPMNMSHKVPIIPSKPLKHHGTMEPLQNTIAKHNRSITYYIIIILYTRNKKMMKAPWKQENYRNNVTTRISTWSSNLESPKKKPLLPPHTIIKTCSKPRGQPPASPRLQRSTKLQASRKPVLSFL